MLSACVLLVKRKQSRKVVPGDVELPANSAGRQVGDSVVKSFALFLRGLSLSPSNGLVAFQIFTNC